MWNKVTSVVGIVAAVGAVWTRFVQMEARVDNSEQVTEELTNEVRQLNSSIQRIEIELARKNYCVAQ